MAVQDTTPDGYFTERRGGPASTYTPGEEVRIWKYGCVYRATVVAVGRTTVTVNFTNKGGNNRDFKFDRHGVEHYLRHFEPNPGVSTGLL